MRIDHVHFYVEDANKWRDWFVNVMGFQSLGGGENNHTQTEIVINGTSTNPIVFVLSSPLLSNSPVAQFLQIHPPGVADVAFAVDDLSTTIKQLTSTGTKLKQSPEKYYFSDGNLYWTQIVSYPGLVHTLVERHGQTPILPYDWVKERKLAVYKQNKLTDIDHIVLNVAVGELEATANWYEQCLGFEKKQTFTIETKQSGLYSQVMVHPRNGIQFPINESLSNNSQIQEFLEINRGAGIQHIALKTNDIVGLTGQLSTLEISFLNVPDTYYQNLFEQNRELKSSLPNWKEIIKQKILLDFEEQSNQEKLDKKEQILLQIFTQPIFEKPTFFFELIERRERVKGFGERNFRALFEAIEQEQIKRGTLVMD